MSIDESHRIIVIQLLSINVGSWGEQTSSFWTNLISDGVSGSCYIIEPDSRVTAACFAPDATQDAKARISTRHIRQGLLLCMLELIDVDRTKPRKVTHGMR